MKRLYFFVRIYESPEVMRGVMWPVRLSEIDALWSDAGGLWFFFLSK